jgi:flagellar P-ring protein precursor FlgI
LPCSADLPPFAKPGQQIDITVSSIGNSKSLRGGSLLMTPMKGIDGNVYAVAQGNLVVGGFDAEGRDGSKITVNVPSSGRIPGGASVERAVPSGFNQGNSLTLNLNAMTSPPPSASSTRSTTCSALASLRPGRWLGARDCAARPQPASRLSVGAGKPGNRSGPDLAKVIINSRTGTIVIGQNVKVSPAAVTHGSLTVTITEDPVVSQPGAFSNGQTAVVPRSKINAQQECSRCSSSARAPPWTKSSVRLTRSARHRAT